MSTLEERVAKNCRTWGLFFDLSGLITGHVLLAPEGLIRTVLFLVLGQEITLIVRVGTVLIRSTFRNLTWLDHMNRNRMEIRCVCLQRRRTHSNSKDDPRSPRLPEKGEERVLQLVNWQGRRRQCLQKSQKLGFCTFDGSVDVCALDVKLGGMVLLDVGGVCEEILPVLVIHAFAEDVLHVLALECEFACFPLIFGKP